jgi:copper homeostasis protein (lipoprotein)
MHSRISQVIVSIGIAGSASLGAAAAGMLGGQGGVTKSIKGTVAYRERIALTPAAVLELTLEDVSKADAPAEVVARQSMSKLGQVPIRFELPYDPSRIVPRHTYNLRARITDRGAVRFISAQATPVLTGPGEQGEVRIMLRSAAGGGGGPPAAGGRPAPPSPSLGALPAAFEGTLPCADCPAIRHTVNLFPDNTYFLRMVYEGKPGPNTFDDLGRWGLTKEGTLVLRGGREGPIYFRPKGDQSLTRLDIKGQPIKSGFNYDYVRQPSFSAIEPRLRLRGMYSYMADAGWFKECLTGKRLAVALEVDNAALERAYSEKRSKPGEEVLARVEGRIVSRPRVEGAGEQPTLIVEKFESITPGETCGTPLAPATLENTYWKLLTLGNQPVVAGDKQREPHLLFMAKDSRIQGSTGCNRLMGSYVRKESSLTFKSGGTMMACPEPLMTQERAFHKALNATKSFKVTGSNLELYGYDGALLARFEAVALK